MAETLRDVKPNPRNPRLIKGARMEKLEEYLTEFGDLSGLVVNADGTTISGHQRTRVFKKQKGKLTILERYDPPAPDGTTARGFVELKDGSRFVYREVDWPQEKADRATIIANGQFGEWDADVLTNEWDMDIPELRDMGVPEFVFGGADFSETEEDEDRPENGYTKKVESPIYEPKNEKPQSEELVDKQKAESLILAIDAAPISEADKVFLRLAAARHMVFNYEKIADFYANSDPDVQRLMEESALVIIDFNKAIELGHIELSKEISNLYGQEYPTEEGHEE